MIFPETKPMNKRERQARRALRLSLRNQPPLTPNAQMRRRQRRLQARIEGYENARTPAKKTRRAIRKSIEAGAGEAIKTLAKVGATQKVPFKSKKTREVLEEMTVSDLRDLCTSAKIPFTTKTKKADLIDKLVGKL